MWQSVKSQARFQLRFCAFVVSTYRLKFISRHPKLRSKCYNHIHDMIWYQIILHLNLQSQHWCKKGAFSIKANRNMIEAKLQQGAWGKSVVIIIYWYWGCPQYLKDPQLGTGWSKATVTSNLSLTYLKITKRSITQRFLESLYGRKSADRTKHENNVIFLVFSSMSLSNL